MNKEEIIKLLNMLYEVTLKKKLSWSPFKTGDGRGYKTNIGDCGIMINIYYSSYSNCKVSFIELFNSNNVKFFTEGYSENDNSPMFTLINQLWMEIEDQRFLISDSKEKIFSNLEKLLESR